MPAGQYDVFACLHLGHLSGQRALPLTSNHPLCSWDMHSGMDSVITAQADPCRASLLVSATQPLMRRAVDIQASPVARWNARKQPVRSARILITLSLHRWHRNGVRQSFAL